MILTNVNLHVNLVMTRREIVFYRKPDGECPIQRFLDSLPSKAAQKAAWVLKLMEDLNRVPANYFCKLTGTEGIWEFRIKWGSDLFRVLAFFDGQKVVLTHGFMKKTRKTPYREIIRAENYKTDYFQD